MKNDDKIYVAFAFNVHDSSVVVSSDSEILLILEAERYFRKKKMRCSPLEMEELIEYALRYCNVDKKDVTAWISTAFQNGFIPEVEGCCDIEFRTIEFLGNKRYVCLVNHHLAHAGCALALGLNNALVYVSDGGGDFRVKNRAYRLEDGELNELDWESHNAMTATFYQHCANYIYGKFHCEGSFMALAAYGEPRTKFVKTLDSLASRLSYSKTSLAIRLLQNTFGQIHIAGSTTFQMAADFASSVQKVFCERRIGDLINFVNSIGIDKPNDLVLLGGTCLNVACNRQIFLSLPLNTIHMPPCCDDTGQALGALMVFLSSVGIRPTISFPFIGRGGEYITEQKEIDLAADYLADGSILVFHHGREEVGPRALGHRSFFCRPDNIELVTKLSRKIKGRAWYRPIAPMILFDEQKEWFQSDMESPYMLTCIKAREKTLMRANSIVHIDGTARLQSIRTNPRDIRYRLLKAFQDRTGLPLVANTSLNGPGEPICSLPIDTKRFFSKIEDNECVLFLNNKVNKKR